MSERWKQTPNGRPAAAADAPGSVPVDRPGRGSGPSEGLPILHAFAQACLAALPDSVERMSPGQTLGLCLFLLGAADRMWSRLGLDDRRYPAAAEAILAELGVAPHKAATIVAALPQTVQDSFARDTLLQGADTFERWYDGTDSDSVLLLSDLVAEWAAAGGPETS
jgi:hypothetical protein